MKIKDEFILRQVADTWIVMPIGNAGVNFNGIMSLNESGCFLWRELEKGATVESLVDALTAEYDVSEEKAQKDVMAFLKSLQKIDCLTV